MITTNTSLQIVGYIGPGGGVALLGPLLGVLCAIAGAVAMIAFWPIRAAIRRIRANQQHTQQPQ